MDYRSFFDRDYIAAFDLNGKDVTLTISKAIGGELTAQGGRKSKRPVVYFEGREKAMVLNRTNGKTIAALYGNDVNAWVGKQITLFPTTTTFGSETVECIRIRPAVPQAAK